jgi:hypothetical protein
MALDPRRGLVESMVACEWLARRVVMEVDVNVCSGDSDSYRRRGIQ